MPVYLLHIDNLHCHFTFRELVVAFVHLGERTATNLLIAIAIKVSNLQFLNVLIHIYKYNSQANCLSTKYVTGEKSKRRLKLA